MGPQAPTGPQQPGPWGPTIQSDRHRLTGRPGCVASPVAPPMSAGRVAEVPVVPGPKPAGFVVAYGLGDWPRTAPRPSRAMTSVARQTFFTLMPPSPFRARSAPGRDRRGEPWQKCSIYSSDRNRDGINGNIGRAGRTDGAAPRRRKPGRPTKVV